MLNRLWKRRFVRRAVYATLVLTAALSTACWYFGINSSRDLKAYAGMALECHPVWQDLALHRICEGQPVDDVIEQTNPVFVVRHGRFVELGYQEPLSFTAVQIVAMDGKVARAGTASCTWDYTFFDSMSHDDAQAMLASSDTNERTVSYNGKSPTPP